MRKVFPRKDRPNVLLSGSAGFIGSHLSAYLQDRYNVFNTARLGAGGAPGRPAITLDLKNKPYAIIHLASRMNTTENAMDLGLLYDNIRMYESIACIARMLKPRKLINFSSMAVYPNQDGLYNEESGVGMSQNADCLYGLSKFCGENILDFILKGEGILISHLRISQVYGDRMRNDRIMPVMLKELKGKNTITVFGGGRRVSDFVHVKKLLPVVELFLKKDISGVFNVGGERLSYLELARRLIRQYGNRKSRIIIDPAGCRARFCLDTRKVKRMQDE